MFNYVSLGDGTASGRRFSKNPVNKMPVFFGGFADDVGQCLEHRPGISSVDATGWNVGALGELGAPNGPKLGALLEEVVTARPTSGAARDLKVKLGDAHLVTLSLVGHEALVTYLGSADSPGAKPYDPSDPYILDLQTAVYEASETLSTRDLAVRVTEFEKDLRKIIALVKHASPSALEIMVLDMIDPISSWPVGLGNAPDVPGSWTENFQAMNSKVESVAADEGVGFFSLAKYFDDAHLQPYIPMLLMADRYHPNDVGARVMGEAICEATSLGWWAQLVATLPSEVRGRVLHPWWEGKLPVGVN